MADDVTLPGTGLKVATDEVAGAHIQRVRLDVGAEGASSPVNAGNPMPVGGPNLASIANDTGLNYTRLDSIDTKTPSLSAGRVPVILPAGFATAAFQSTIDTNITAINTKLAAGVGVAASNASATGTLSASDAVVGAPVGDGTLVTGASTAGSVVALAVPPGFQAWTLLIKGYVSGVIYTEASNNSTNGTDGDWVEVKGRRTGTAPGTESVVYAMVANGYYRGNAAGFTYIRARLIGGTGPTIGWMLSNGQGATFLNSGIPAGSSSIGSVTVTGNGVVSTANSSAANLGAGAVFTGTAEDISDYSTAVVSLFSSHASAVDGLQIQQSPDGTNWDQVDAFSIPAATGKSFSAPVQGRFFRIVYTNGATLTTALRIQTLFSKSAKKDSSVRPVDGRGNDNDFEENLSYMMGFNGTTWDRLRSTVAAGLQVQELDLYITGQGSQLTLGQNVALAAAGAGSVDALGYRSVGISITPAAGTVTAGAVTFEESNDNVNWVVCPLYDDAAPTGVPVFSFNLVAATTRAFSGALHLRYFRARISTGVTGTTTGVQAFTLFKPTAFFPAQVTVNQATAASMQVTADTEMPAAAASADGAANPTTPQVMADGMVFNGTTWDRLRGNWNTTTGDTGAKTATGNGATQTNYNNAGATVVINMGVVSGTTPTFDAKLQYSADGGTTWVDMPGASWTQITATGVFALTVSPSATAAANAVVARPLPRTWRLVWTIGGTTPSFTITNVQVAYHA